MIPMWRYPDFSQILLKPQFKWQFSLPANCTPASIGTTYWFSVNWTPVNFIWSALSESDYYKWTSTASNYWFNWYFGWPTVKSAADQLYQTDTIRIWATWQLEWWEIIWRQVFAKVWRYVGDNFSDWNHRKLVMGVKPWLLHTDWTITYATEVNSNEIRINRYTTFWWVIVNWTTDWIEAQAWDYVIVDVAFKFYYFYVNTWNENVSVYYKRINFWIDWSPNVDWTVNGDGDSRPCPIQISIE